jgi:hypothetical protein
MSRPFCICIDVTFFATQLHSTYHKLHYNKKGVGEVVYEKKV